MELLYLILGLSASILGVITNALSIYDKHIEREGNKQTRERQENLKNQVRMHENTRGGSNE